MEEWYGWIQQMPGMCLKTIDYSYSPINGKLIKVDYQKYIPEERFIHQYTYNLAGQLSDVHTSLNNTVLTRQAHYIYNESGALSRTELADNLQGIDYVYNLGGQLKAINHPSILPNQDPGGDGMPGSGFAADVFGMAIDYYNGDYTRTGTPKPITTTPQGTDQYNGNIKAIRWNTQVPNTTLNAYTYSYNKNNWLSDANFGSSDLSANIISNPNKDYKEGGIIYDANGNIQTLLRNGYTDSAGTNNMDNLTYHYSSSLPNRLLNVRDNADNADTNRYNDIRNQDIGVNTGSATTAGANISTTLENYLYNDLGQLTTNLQDKIFYEYNVSGLVTKIGTLVDDNEAEGYKTIYFNNYETFTSNNHGWLNVGVFDNSYFTLGINSSCNELTDATDYNNTALQINGKITARKFFKTTANTSFKLNLDVIIDNLLQDPAYSNPFTNIGSGQNTSSDGELPPSLVGPTPSSFSPVILQHPTVTVNLKRPDGTIIYSQTVTGTSAQSPNYCGRYFPTHIDTGAFTTTTEQYVILELIVSNELVNTTSNNNKSKYQITYLDNLKLEVATKTKVAFYYNDRGERSKKESYLDNGNTSSSYYIRDASGNVMCIYNSLSGPTVKFGGEPKLVEHTIYGNSRIGIFKRTDKTSGYALYELTDHLGNVRAVLQKTGNAIYALTNKTDYYPFGMTMPNKTTTDGNYRYAFQGQEKDSETGMEAFELRLWDGRLGRWLTVDPYGQYFSPYLGMGNNPISITDPTGGSAEPPNEYDENGNLISTLGGDKIDFIHQKDGSIIIQNCSTGDSVTTKKGMDILKGFENRNRNIDYMDVFDEFKKGYGPKRSLFDGSHPMTIDMKESQAAYQGRALYMSNGGKKGYVAFDFGITGIFSAGGNMTEQMVGSAGVSIYPIGDKVVFIITDTKTPRSLFYHLPGIRSIDDRDSNPTGRLMPYSETKQTYIWSESVKTLKAKHNKHEKANESGIIMP
jgi:RHS repeat-associated protein